MIPKVIHYCWFGRNPKPEFVNMCINSWKKHCPEYTIVEWNEDNYNLQNTPKYVQQAYKAKKWAFVTDYVRLDVIYTHGGIYLDTDVELIKNLDSLLNHSAFIGIENTSNERYSINTGLGFGATKNNSVIKELKNFYQDINFLDENGNENLLTTPAYTTAILEKKGFQQKNEIQNIDGVVIYPTEYFSPKQYSTGKIAQTDNTYSIHHYSESWKSKSEIEKQNDYMALTNKYGVFWGEIFFSVKYKFLKK